MDRPNQAVNSQGGAIFQGNVRAGRDITINHFTEIRQVTEQLYSQCSSLEDLSDKLLGRLDVLNGTAEFIEEYAKELRNDLPLDDVQLQRIFRECASVLSDLKQLLFQVEGCDTMKNGSDAATPPHNALNEEITDLRARLMSVQLNLSQINNRKIAKDTIAIKEAVTELMNNTANTDDTSSIKTFYTASSIPYVERQMWRELEKALRARFPVEFVRDNYALIVETVEEVLWGADSSEPVGDEEFLSTNTEMPISGASDRTKTLVEGRGKDIDSDPILEQHATRRPPEHTSSNESYDSIGTVHGDTVTQADGTGSAEASDVNIKPNQFLLSLDGEGVKSYSTALILQALMKEIVRFENAFEKEFTFYPRNFDAGSLRLCHYFHKMYGASTGGLLAIALSRLRMTVSETIDTFRELLTAMYGSRRHTLPLAPKYNHSAFEKELVRMAQKHCKQHQPGLCDSVERFPWRPAEEAKEQAKGKRGLHAEDHLCQTICLTTVLRNSLSERYLLRSYNHRYDLTPIGDIIYNEGAEDLAIWQVARASTAAPSYFKMLEASIGVPPQVVGFREGGIKEDNLSNPIWLEHVSLHPDDNEPLLFLSISAGISNALSERPLGAYQKITRVLAAMKQLATDSQDRNWLMIYKYINNRHTWYNRFNVSTGLEGLALDQWESGYLIPFESTEPSIRHSGGKTMNKIQIATEAYLGTIEVKTKLSQTAEKLVRIRRAREYEAMTEGGEKRERWEAYMGKHLAGEWKFFENYIAQWDYALLGRKTR